MNFNTNWICSQPCIIVAPAFFINQDQGYAILNEVCDLPLLDSSRTLKNPFIENQLDFKANTTMMCECDTSIPECEQQLNCSYQQKVSMLDYSNEYKKSYAASYPNSPSYLSDYNKACQEMKFSHGVLDQKNYWMVQYKQNPLTKRQNTVYVCRFPGCGKEFKKKWNYTEHFKSHTQEKPYQCPECGKYFSQKGSMIKHMKARSQEGNDHGFSKLEEAMKERNSTD